MVSVDNIIKQSKQLIYEMNSRELKQFLMDLTRKYYLAYINDDSDSMELINTKINEVMIIYDNAAEIKQYFNYCIALNSNIIIKSIIKNDNDLLIPFELGSEKDFESLHERIQRNVEYFKALDKEIMQE